MRSSTSVHTVGNITNIDLRVVVENLGDDAYEAIAHIYIPSELDYVNVDLERAPVGAKHMTLLMNYKSTLRLKP